MSFRMSCFLFLNQNKNHKFLFQVISSQNLRAYPLNFIVSFFQSRLLVDAQPYLSSSKYCLKRWVMLCSHSHFCSHIKAPLKCVSVLPVFSSGRQLCYRRHPNRTGFATKDPLDHLYKISYSKHCIVGMSQYILCVVIKLVSRFPITSLAMIIAFTKHKKSSETKVGEWRKALSWYQLEKFSWNSNLQTLAQEQTKWRPDSGAFRVKYG